jgi:hypothetical protein
VPYTTEKAIVLVIGGFSERSMVKEKFASFRGS